MAVDPVIQDARQPRNIHVPASANQNYAANLRFLRTTAFDLGTISTIVRYITLDEAGRQELNFEYRVCQGHTWTEFNMEC